MAARRKPLDLDFADIANSAPPPASTPPVVTASVTASQPDNVTVSQGDKRKTSSHVSLYLSPKVIKAVKQLALDRDMKAHDIYLEGLRYVLGQHGKDLDALNAD